MIEIWKSKINYKKVGYYKNGQKSIKENNSKQTKYFLNGTIKTHFTRKEVSKLRRIFSNDKNRWFEYQCNIYDSLGNKIAYIKFKGNVFSDWNIFPENLSEINETQFEAITIFENNQIRVLSVSPGLIDTDMTGAIPQAEQDKIISNIPLRRMGYADEIAKVVSFLISDGASFVNGSTIHVNGGL